jgi:hypothetical protein
MISAFTVVASRVRVFLGWFSAVVCNELAVTGYFRVHFTTVLWLTSPDVVVCVPVCSRVRAPSSVIPHDSVVVFVGSFGDDKPVQVIVDTHV